MRSVGSFEDGVSATIFDNNNVSSRPMASVVCEEVVPREAADKEDKNVCLPPRYKQRLLIQKGRDTSLSSTQSSTSSSSTHKVADDLNSREKDLGVALKWIRQEILQMKEQDKSLLKQFIQLRASILQLRCMYEYHSSNSDLSSYQGSTVSLNDAHKRRHKASIIPRSDSDFLDLTSRTKSLLSLQGSPRCTRIKWRSDEII